MIKYLGKNKSFKSFFSSSSIIFYFIIIIIIINSNISCCQTINHIQNKVFVYIICVYCVYLLCLYKYTHIHVYI